MSAIRAGVIGVGRLGAEHARLLSESPSFRLAGVCDIDGERARRVAETVGSTWVEDPRELAGDVDAIVVAVPTRHHAMVASRCLESGCHVLVEKPLARRPEEADALVALAGRLDRVLGVGHVERFNGILLACEPHLGRIRYLESQRLAPFQSRGTDVTVVLDLMIHDIDLVLELVGAPLQDVRAIGTAVLSDSLDMANARLAFEGGAVANISASRVSMKPVRRIRLFQDTGYFSLDLAAGTGEHYRRRADEGQSPRTLGDLVERVPLSAAEGEPLARELEAFARAIRGESTRLVTGEKGREALAVAQRITREIERTRP